MSEKKKIYAVNGSPRKSGNTAVLLQKALDGAAAQGAETRLIHLTDLAYSGCKSCFGCKLKGGVSYGKCALRDELSPILAELREADGILFGTPIYFGSESGLFRNFIERLYFPVFRYDKAYTSLQEKAVKTAFIYTMNVPEEGAVQHKYAERLRMAQVFGGRVFHAPEPPVLYACNTWQFDDYSKYDAELFDVEDKARSRREEFPEYCKAAFAIGEDMAR